MKRFFAPLLLLFVVNACTTFAVAPPETPRERLAATEISYQTAVRTLNQFLTEGKISENHFEELRNALTSVRTALNVWHGNPDLETSELTAVNALSTLQTLLRRFEKGASRL